VIKKLVSIIPVGPASNQDLMLRNQREQKKEIDSLVISRGKKETNIH